MMAPVPDGMRGVLGLFECGNELDQTLNQMLVRAGPGSEIRFAELSDAFTGLLGDRLHLLQGARDTTKGITGMARIDLEQSRGLRRGVNRLVEVPCFGAGMKKLGSLKLLGMSKRVETRLAGDFFLRVSGIVDHEPNPQLTLSPLGSELNPGDVGDAVLVDQHKMRKPVMRKRLDGVKEQILKNGGADPDGAGQDHGKRGLAEVQWEGSGDYGASAGVFRQSSGDWGICPPRGERGVLLGAASRHQNEMFLGEILPYLGPRHFVKPRYVSPPSPSEPPHRFRLGLFRRSGYTSSRGYSITRAAVEPGG